VSYPVIIKCPVCSDRLKVTKLHCIRCNTKFEGEFHLDKFSYLSLEQKRFIEVFLRCRGNIKEVEKELNISYPTVRGKLDDVIQSLGYAVSDTQQKKSRKEILSMLSSGEITYEEAMDLLNK
jgi:hypothetical protein